VASAYGCYDSFARKLVKKRDNAVNDEEIISIVASANIDFELGTRQDQYNQRRFFNNKTYRSLNLGYRGTDGPFVADFVFKGKAKEINDAQCDAFLVLFGGTRGKRRTAFARLEISFFESAWLVQVIQCYWAMGNVQGA
jgi:hypothetical protein